MTIPGEVEHIDTMSHLKPRQMKQVDLMNLEKESNLSNLKELNIVEMMSIRGGEKDRGDDEDGGYQ